MIYRILENGEKVVVEECTMPLGQIQAEKLAAKVLEPTLDINPCSATPLADLVNNTTK